MILEWLDAHLHYESVLWLFPIVFMFHDFEEILTVEKWSKENREEVLAILPQPIRKSFADRLSLTTLQFARDVFWIFLAITTATVLAVVFSFYPIFFMFVAVFFLHVFTHIGQALILKKYTPGLVTAVILVFPYSLYACHRISLERGFTGIDLVWSGIGAFVILPMLFLLLLFGRSWIRPKGKR